jgi:hypothetical protein
MFQTFKFGFEVNISPILGFATVLATFSKNFANFLSVFWSHWSKFNFSHKIDNVRMVGALQTQLFYRTGS